MLYAGYQYDTETGLYYLNARMYDSKTARFIQEDTYRGNKTDPLSLNLYTYCANNPLKYEDPTGHNFIKSALTKGAKAVKKAAKKAVKAVKKVAKAAKTVVKKVVSAVKYVVKTVVKYVTKAVKYVANKVQQFWNSPGETVQSVISDAQRALEERRKAVEAKIQAYQQSDTMKFALTATAVDNSMDASEKGGILDMLGDFVDAKLNDLSGLANNAFEFAMSNKSLIAHSTLDIIGLLPGVGNIADGLNAVIYLAEGDMANAAWSLFACVPVASVAATTVRFGGKALDATTTFIKNSDKISGFLDTGKTALKKTGDLFSDFFAGAKRVLSDTRGSTTVETIVPKPIAKFLMGTGETADEVLGGSYKQLKGKGGNAHHMPADSVSPLNKLDGPAIKMTSDDHMKTASWGNSKQAKEYRAMQKDLIDQGLFREAQQMDIDDIHSKFGDKYDAGINQMLDYTDGLDDLLK